MVNRRSLRGLSTLAAVLAGATLSAAAYAASVVGTPGTITWGTNQDPAGQSVTVETGANAFVMGWAYFQSVTGAGLATATLGGAAADEVFEVPIVSASFESGCGIAIWYDPPTGSQTLDVSWDAAPGDGPTTIYASLQNVGEPLRDSDGGNSPGATAISVTLTTVAGDLVLKYDTRFAATAPALSSGWTSGNTQANVNGMSSRLSYIVATGTSQAANAEDESDSCMAAIAVIDDPGGGEESALPVILQQQAANDDEIERPLVAHSR